MFQPAAAAATPGPTGGRKKHKRGEEADEDEKTDKATCKLLWSLDNRVRQLEGQIPSHFLKVRICMKATGATQNDGPPPMGPLIRDIPRYK